METRIAYLRPGQIAARLRKAPVVFIPIGPLEWHAPHLPLGVDPLNAEQVALAVCERIGGVVWPTLFWGTERERPPAVLEHLGFRRDEWIVGMDFPGNVLPSAYCREEILALLVHETLRLVARMGAKVAVIVNGHGAVNHNETLKRLAAERNHEGVLHVHLRMAMPRQKIEDGSIAHAGSDETSLMLHYAPETVRLRELPPPRRRMRYRDFSIVDGPGFDGKGHPDRIVEDDPRTKSSSAHGRAIFETTVKELTDEVRALLKTIHNRGERS